MSILNKKHLKRALLFTIIATLISLSLIGCSIISSSRKAKAQKLLEKKYNEKFEVDTYRGQQWYEEWYSVLAHSKNYPNLKFKAEIDTDNMVTDKYVQRRVGNTVKQRIIDSSDIKIKGNYVVEVYSTVYYTVTEDPNISPEDYDKENPTNDYVINVYLDKTQNDEADFERYAGNIANNLPNLHGWLAFYIIEPNLIPSIQDYFTREDDIYSELDDMIGWSAHIVDYKFSDGKATLGASNK